MTNHLDALCAADERIKHMENQIFVLDRQLTAAHKRNADLAGALCAMLARVSVACRDAETALKRNATVTVGPDGEIE